MEYLFSGQEIEADRMVSEKTIQAVHAHYSNVLTGIGCFKGTFSSQMKDDAMLFNCYSGR